MNSKLDNFNPNSKKPPTIEWATYVPGRTTAPEFKVHKRKSDALSAVTSESILYRLIDNVWTEVFKVDGYIPPDYCEKCEKSVHKFSTNWKGEKYKYHNGYRKWKSTTPPNISWIYLCLDCARKWKPEK